MRALMLLVLLGLCNVGHTEEFTTRIIVVIDGDTVVIRRASGLMKIRLAEIDAPETGQPFGAESKQSLSNMVLRQQVKVTSRAIDKYGRMVANLNLNGLDVNAEQVRRGMAWDYHGPKEMAELQQQAKAASRGLWAQKNPIPPWDWRSQHPSTGSTTKQPHSPKTSKPHKSTKTSHKKTNSLDPSCGTKKHCSQMSSCEEAKHYFTVCGIKSLDRNHDGILCDKLCSGQSK